jgi:hypothetical protein
MIGRRKSTLTMNIEISNDQEILGMVWVVMGNNTPLRHLVPPNESVKKFDRYVTLCGKVADEKINFVFTRYSLYEGIPCPECIKEYRTAREIFGTIWVRGDQLPLKLDDPVVVVAKDSENKGKKGKVTEWHGIDKTTENQVWVEFTKPKDYLSFPLKFERYEIAYIIQQ